MKTQHGQNNKCIKHLLGVRGCSRLWNCGSEQEKHKPLLMEAINMQEVANPSTDPESGKVDQSDDSWDPMDCM